MGQFCHLELKVHNSKDSNGDLKDCISKEESNPVVDYLSTCLELPYSQPNQGPWKLCQDLKDMMIWKLMIWKKENVGGHHLICQELRGFPAHKIFSAKMESSRKPG